MPLKYEGIKRASFQKENLSLQRKQSISYVQIMRISDHWFLWNETFDSSIYIYVYLCFIVWLYVAQKTYWYIKNKKGLKNPNSIKD